MKTMGINKKGVAMISFFFLVGIVVALPVFADWTQGIIPECSAGYCTLCDAWKLADNIINFLLQGVAIPLLTITLIWGGTLWVTSGTSPDNIKKGKTIMTNGLIGILIAFCGWLIVDTIIKSLASGGEIVGAWSTMPECKAPIADERLTFQDVMPGAGSSPTAGVTSSDGYFSDAEARSAFQAAGISVKSNFCDQNQPLPPSQCPEPRPSKSGGGSCTSLDRIPKRVLVNLKRVVGIQFYVSGGTEAGHITHKPCAAVVDLVPGRPGSPNYSMLGTLRN